jgi:hypothetical protein
MEVIMASKAVERRFDAIRGIGERFRPESNGYHLTSEATPEAIIEAIRELAPLGRTDRWQAAVKQWESLVTDYPESLDWAILQGSVYAGYAAE